MNANHPSTDLLFVTVLIKASNDIGTVQTGTGFIISIPSHNSSEHIPILITNKHVITGASRVFIDLFKSDPNNKLIKNEKITIELDIGHFNNFQDENLDIAFVPIAFILKDFMQKKLNIFYKAVTPLIACSLEQESKLGAIEEVTFIGYPYGLKDVSQNLPISRRGITATPVWSNYKNDSANETFLIDAGVFPGSSGSPVFIYNHGSYSDGSSLLVGTRIIFLGMIKSSIQAGKQFIGLGEVIKSRIIFKFIEEKLNLTENNNSLFQKH